MKETKVYVDDETLMKCERYRHNSCPIIQTHDRELVKKVLNKVKKVAFSSKVMCDKDGSPFYGEKNHTIYGIYDYELDEIQKEHEK